ncbi:GDSL-like Lipase/Acylhydrolase [Rubripirellula tenax]|uniref:GDSL-like Lipase/Acylhydrolase n=1 Tax=Rubripirellula tenax TaxID=2528015 RepID=A0A5C6EM27_9BACT|nr:SGNH/GDSL hydrolase family protein [Rubripirellula tenax]TWU50803.1 GDSL-like Lipase/Acylhydrolase [Rubripirellula tenax]
MRSVLSGLACLFATFAVGDEPAFPLTAKRIVFLGDSITYAGHYVDVIDATVVANGYGPEIINLGLSSETCSGLTEPDHPFPRPNVQTRLDRALSVLKPDVVVACYGMNDGIYHPFSEERFAIYKKGVNDLIDKVTASGAKLVLMTPPPFDPVPIQGTGKLVPIDAIQFGWKTVYENYDREVIKKYGDWVKQQSDRVAMVIDLHAPVTSYLEANRAVDPRYTLSADGVHITNEGHRILADAILDAWGLSDRKTADEEDVKKTAARQAIMKAAWLTEVGHDRPGINAGLPIDEAKQETSEIK